MAISTIALIDAENFTRLMRTLDLSATGSGPWVPCHALTDSYGIVVERDNPLFAHRSIKNTVSGFARPSDTLAYATGDLIADASSDIVFAAGVPFVQPANFGGSMVLRGMRLRKTSTNVVNATFRVHLFSDQPTNIVYDNVAFGCIGIDKYLGMTAEYTMTTLGDGAMAWMPSMSGGSTLCHRFAQGTNSLYWLLEARAPYIPTLGENFTLEVISEFD